MKKLTPKRSKVLMHKLVVLKLLELEVYDELKPTTEIMLNQIKFCEQLVDSLKDTETMIKHTYFNDIANKVDTILRKEFNELM